VPGRPPIPVILLTDIGDEIDDTWALVTLLKSPEVDLRLVVADTGNTAYRARIAARLLEIAGRTDVALALGPKESGREGGQAEWVGGYDLSRYPGPVHEDAVRALVDTVMASKEPLTLVSIGPCPSLKAALEREPRIAGKLRLAGTYGSLRRGYGGKPTPEPEWNVHSDPAAARALLAAPWLEVILTPLDTSAVVRLKGARYARVRDAKDPLLRALVENYRLWCPHERSCTGDPERAFTESSVLYDTVAVYLALARDLVRTETLGVRVSEEGLTVPDAAAPPLTWATAWTSLDAYEEWLASRLTSPTVPPRGAGAAGEAKAP
jgi:inosine-uridine nucleoside N-ribohydrolase